MYRVLIVEDEIFVAMEIEHIVEEIGLQSVGIAADMRTALALADQADLAIVDVNLRDGRTGCAIAEQLTARFGISVLFMTANPSLVGAEPGAIGVISKPASNQDLTNALSYAIAHRDHVAATPPANLHLLPRHPVQAVAQ